MKLALIPSTPTDGTYRPADLRFQDLSDVLELVDRTMVAHICTSSNTGSTSAKRCSGCKKVWYCSAKCQKAHWATHIFSCRIDKPIDSAYHLARACNASRMPSDMQARIDFGFDKALAIVGIDAQNKLLGLWSWICVCRAIPPQELPLCLRNQASNRLHHPIHIERNRQLGVLSAFETVRSNQTQGYTDMP
ncbi:hypothetical protein BD309DRAFT_161982 [Dichomitus squalens]|nr:hypothetical protein BD309DRAFT_161982 [Dichomitus squalens]